VWEQNTKAFNLANHPDADLTAHFAHSEPTCGLFRFQVAALPTIDAYRPLGESIVWFARREKKWEERGGGGRQAEGKEGRQAEGKEGKVGERGNVE